MKKALILLLAITYTSLIFCQEIFRIYIKNRIERKPISYIDSISFKKVTENNLLAQLMVITNIDGSKEEYNIEDIDSINIEFRKISNKQGFVIFRVDDNHSSNEMIPTAKLMEKYGFKMVWAFNNSNISNDRIEAAKYFNNRGHEIVDHTPSHTTGYADILYQKDIEKFVGVNGVEKIVGKRVFFDWLYPELFKCKILNDTLETIKGTSIIKTANMNLTTDYHVFTNEFGWICLKDINQKQANAINAKTGELLIFTNNSKQQLYAIKYHSVLLSNDGMKMLLLASQLNFEFLGLNYFKYWCWPGGNWAYVSAEVLRNAGENVNYKGGSGNENYLSFPMTYNQSNDLDKWSSYPGSVNYINSTNLSPSDWKKNVANEIAKHKCFIDLGHMWYPYNTVGNLFSGTKDERFKQYLANLEEMLKFCFDNDIPVLTYKDAIKVLYDSLPNPTTNIFPPLYRDLSNQSYPDGYTLNSNTTLVKTLGVLEDHGISLKRNGSGIVFTIKDIGGIENGENLISFFAKSIENNKIVSVKISSDKLSQTICDIKIPISNTLNDFVKYETIVNIPNVSNLYTIEFSVSGNENTDLYISGMCLKKIK